MSCVSETSGITPDVAFKAIKYGSIEQEKYNVQAGTSLSSWANVSAALFHTFVMSIRNDPADATDEIEPEARHVLVRCMISSASALITHIRLRAPDDRNVAIAALALAQTEYYQHRTTSCRNVFDKDMATAGMPSLTEFYETVCSDRLPEIIGRRLQQIRDLPKISFAVPVANIVDALLLVPNLEAARKVLISDELGFLPTAADATAHRLASTIAIAVKPPADGSCPRFNLGTLAA